MWRKMICMFLIFVLFSSIFTACKLKDNVDSDTTSAENDSETSKEEADQENNDSKEGVKTVRFWQLNWGGRYNEMTEKIIAEFEKTHKNIDVVLEPALGKGGITAYDDKVIPAVVAGAAPEIIHHRSIPDCVRNDILLDVTDAYKGNDPNFNESIFYPWKLEEVKYKGRYYGFPYQTYVHNIMLYNKTIFKEVGLDPNVPPRTLEEVDSMSEKMYLLNDSGLYDRVGFFPWQFIARFPESIAANFGGSWIDSEGRVNPDANIIKALNWMRGYSVKYGYEKVNKSNCAFSEGEVGIEAGWLGTINELITKNVSFEWSIAPFPTVEGSSSAWPGGWNVSILKDSKNPEAAVEFLKFFCGKEGQSIMMTYFDTGILGGWAPIHEVNLQQYDKMHPVLQILFEQIIPNVPAREGGYYLPVLIGDACGGLIDKVVKGEGEVTHLVEEFKKQAEAILKEAESKKVIE